MIEILKLSIVLTLGIVASIIIFGLIIGKIERTSSQLLFNRFGKISVISTGIIGTTIHEFSHALMCIIFSHTITHAKWFSFRLEGSELGHIEHSFNKRSVYQRIGNFFIGIAPIVIGSFILIIFYRIFLKDSFYYILDNTDISKFSYLGGHFNLLDFIQLLLTQFIIFIAGTFTFDNITSFSFWIFLIISISISTHMSLSKADLKNSLDGIIFIFLINLFISIIIVLFKIPETIIISKVILFNVFLVSFLSIGLFFALITLMISKLISLTSIK